MSGFYLSIINCSRKKHNAVGQVFRSIFMCVFLCAYFYVRILYVGIFMRFRKGAIIIINAENFFAGHVRKDVLT